MKLAIMQPYFFPYIGYWQLINAVDKYVIYDDVNFINRGWINRNYISICGERKQITLELRASSQNKLINEIELVADLTNRRKFLRTIEMNYKKAPCFLKVFPIIEEIINNKERNLAKNLEYSIRRICNYLAINTEIIVSSELHKNNMLHGSEKVMEICHILGADEYINAIGGQELYSYEDFRMNGIKLSFLKTGVVTYKQLNNDFLLNLSIIDVMMFNSVEDINSMLANFHVISEDG